MSDLLAKQMQLQRSIERWIENFKKLGRASQTPARIRSRIAALKDVWAQFQDGHNALQRSISSTGQDALEYFRENHFERTEDVYLNSLDHMSECLEEVEPVTNREITLNQTHEHINTTALSHLPPISLPPFDGRYEDWEQFRDRFTSLIIQNRDLSNFSRMHYLSSSLRGRALECISGLSITSDNFNIAWKTLSARFENKRRLINRHIASLFELPVVNRESATALQAIVDQVNTAVYALRNLNRTAEESQSDILVYLISRKLDSATLKAWNLRASDDETPPSYEDLLKFLAARSRALEECNESSFPTVGSSGRRAPPNRISSSAVSASAYSKCALCDAKHYLNACSRFLSQNPGQRRDFVQTSNLCFNCLGRSHAVQDCRSKYTCRLCQKRHHTLLHIESEALAAPSGFESTGESGQPDNARAEILSLCSAIKTKLRVPVLLGTAWVTVKVPSGRSIVVRALLDNGSEMTLLSENIAQLLRAKRLRMPTEVNVVGEVSIGVHQYATQIIISPRNSDTPAFSTTALILNKLTSYTPKRVETSSAFEHLADLPWADPDPTSSDPIGIIIGSDLHNEMLLGGLRKGVAGQPSALNTVFGWIISGSITVPSESRAVTNGRVHLQTSNVRINIHHCQTALPLDQELRRFWELEEIPAQTRLSPLEEQCELHFQKTHSRDADGRYVVRLPFKTGPPIEIGSSFYSAERMLGHLHRRLKNSPEQQQEYADFLNDYESSGHMSKVPVSSAENRQRVYIPHHSVVKESSVTTRLRVVFNASSITTNGTSLNDHLLIGPKLQTDLPAVMLQWRKYRFVYSADIKQMYRQIRVDARDADYQRILWNPNPNERPHIYKLVTVTYGTASAPFLALRVIQQLVRDEGDQFPLAVSVLRENIYIDDVLFGENDLTSVRQTRDQLRKLLLKGGFELRKWASNSAELLADLAEEQHGLACGKLLQTDEQIKILGLSWIPATDVFQFHVKLEKQVPKTKRAILSTIAKLFDPLGWVTPITASAKVFMQRLWRLKIDWDDVCPTDALRQWQSIYEGFGDLNGLSVPRWTGLSPEITHTELHGFADASSVAYAAAVYLKVVSSSGHVRVTLLAGRSRVAPVNPMSIPRLELAAGVLLARLITFVQQSLGATTHSCVCWTDSTVVLAWLQQHPSRWKTFVANRVADIQSRLPGISWRHVPTNDNPADCASRGLLGRDLLSHELWWHGPSWLSLPEPRWPVRTGEAVSVSDIDREERVVVAHIGQSSDKWDLSSRYSSWLKLIHVTAYVRRFVQCCRARTDCALGVISRPIALSASECQTAQLFWFRRIQTELFSAELHALSTNKPISSRSSLLSLTPFLDGEGMLRVGGRLENSQLPFHQKHPIILASHALVKLYVAHVHLRMLHAGTQLTLATLRHEIWIIQARNLVKSVIHRCVRCVRENAALSKQLMGTLPNVRVTPSARSFLHCGLDYAGPVSVRASVGRGIRSVKAYIAIFVCMATRAVHLELVGSYSTNSFLDAFSRFCSRRGLPESMYSDNGTTFVGADRELAKAHHTAIRDPNFLNKTAADRVSWHFIPPSAPHFGGLWEAGVRSVKYHLRRVLGSHALSFEEFTTLLCRIEACLNSRPIAPLHESDDNYEVLTPGHFLIGSSLAVPPEPSTLAMNENRLSRWQLVRHLTERFWKLWQNDYLNILQQRVKWKRVQKSIRIGHIVLLRHDSLPPCKWELGRVTRCHPGKDGLTRVVTVKTALSEYKRPIAKLCLLPVDVDKVLNE